MRFTRSSYLKGTVGLLLLVSGAARAQQPATEVQIFPQIFHLDAGNTSRIHVQNPGESAILAGLEFTRPDGSLLPGPSKSVPALGSAPFYELFQQDFVGTASLSCSGLCLATASWTFQVGGDRIFEVGLLPEFLSRRSTQWGAPVPRLLERTAYGFAIYNTVDVPVSCEISFHDLGGSSSGAEQVSLPAFGQISQFAESIESGFAGGALLTCDQEVIAMGLIQDLSNGFPTYINYTPLR